MNKLFYLLVMVLLLACGGPSEPDEGTDPGFVGEDTTLIDEEWIDEDEGEHGDDEPDVIRIGDIQIVSQQEVWGNGEEKGYQVNVIYPHITGLSDNVGKALNELIADHVSSYGEVAEEFEEYMKEEMKSEYYSGVASTLDVDYSIAWHCDSVLTVVWEGYYYQSGAAHGSHSTEAMVYHIPYKLMLAGSDLFPDTVRTYPYLTDLANQKLFEDEDYAECWGLEDEKEIRDYMDNMIVTEYGLTFFFGDYALCPYAFGAPELDFTWEELDGHIDAPFGGCD